MGRVHEMFAQPSTLTPEQREAIEEAQAGNWEKADAMELAYINNKRNGIYPHRGDDSEEPVVESADEFKAVEILRHYGPQARTAV
jgi:hypothetical protein